MNNNLTFTEALDKLINDGKAYIGTHTFFCITSDKLISNQEVLVIDYYGLRKLKIDFDDCNYSYTHKDLIKAEWFKDCTWHYFETWDDLKEYKNALA